MTGRLCFDGGKPSAGTGQQVRNLLRFRGVLIQIELGTQMVDGRFEVGAGEPRIDPVKIAQAGDQPEQDRLRVVTARKWRPHASLSGWQYEHEFGHGALLLPDAGRAAALHRYGANGCKNTCLDPA